MMKIEKNKLTKGSLNYAGIPISKQIDFINKTGFWYNMCNWYSNNFEKNHNNNSTPTSFSVFNETEDTDEFTLCEISINSLGFFDELFPKTLSEYIRNNAQTEPEIRILGAENKDNFAAGCIALRIKEKGACEILWLYVAKEVRH